MQLPFKAFTLGGSECYRGDNGCEDCLANLGYQLNYGQHAFDFVPSCIYFQLRANVKGDIP